MQTLIIRWQVQPPTPAYRQKVPNVVTSYFSPAATQGKADAAATTTTLRTLKRPREETPRVQKPGTKKDRQGNMQNTRGKECESRRTKTTHFTQDIAKRKHRVNNRSPVTQPALFKSDELDDDLEPVDTSDEDGDVSNDSDQQQGPSQKRRKRKPRNVSLMFMVIVKLRLGLRLV